jgi:ADP-ribose pyrophosphatase YjhB (NUDIX family)
MTKLMTSIMASLFAASSRHVVRRAPAVRSLSTLLTQPATIQRKRIPQFAVAVTCLLASASTLTFCEADEFAQNVLEFDSYNGVILQVNDTVASDDFGKRLEASLVTWALEGKRGIWIHIPPELAHLVPICTAQGFDFHFAKPGMLVLTKWLPEDTESRLPMGPTHQVGIGALVVNDQGQMLVVQEKTGPAANYKIWKMPTGLLDRGEDIGMAATRELQEETGLDADMQKVLCFRQAHAGGDRGSDMFFICLMKLHDKRQTCVLQEEEIEAVKWMDMEEFCAQDLWQQSPAYKELNEAMRNAINAGGMDQKILDVGFRPGTNAIYVPSML